MINKTNFVILTTMIPALRALNAFNMVDESFIEDISSYLGIEDKQVIIDWLNDNILNNEDRYDRCDNISYFFTKVVMPKRTKFNCIKDCQVIC